MRQTRLSIGCRDWQKIIETLGAVPAGIYLYLRTLMRGMQTAEISITVPELAKATGVPEFAADSALRAICGRYMTRADGPDGIITLVCQSEKQALAEAARKRTERALKRSKKAIGQSEYIFFNQTGPSADSPASRANASEEKEYTSEVMMYYHPQPGEPGRDESSYYFRKKKQKEKHALSDNQEPADKNKKTPRTPEKEKTLTEHTAPASASAPARDAELPADQLEADYIDVCGAMPQSLRTALREQHDDVREAFCLYCRKKRDELGSAWTADAMRVAWLAARRIPEERRADSILAAYMGGWKTIRDSGSGVYFDKATGRVMSLVRGPVSTVNPAGGTASKSALDFARKMRRA